MFALAALMSLITQVSGTPYIPGGDTPAGTDCSGLASWVANVASGRPAFGSRFNTGNMESALLARGFHYGSAPNSVVIGWNSGHAAVTLPDGTPVSSGESGTGVRVGGGGAYQPQFSKLMYLPVQAQEMDTEPESDPAAADQTPPGDPADQTPPGDPADQTPPGDPADQTPPGDPADVPPGPAPESGPTPAPLPPADPDTAAPPAAPVTPAPEDPAPSDVPPADALPAVDPAPGSEPTPEQGRNADQAPASEAPAAPEQSPEPEMTAPIPA